MSEYSIFREEGDDDEIIESPASVKKPVPVPEKPTEKTRKTTVPRTSTSKKEMEDIKEQLKEIQSIKERLKTFEEEFLLVKKERYEDVLLKWEGIKASELSKWGNGKSKTQVRNVLQLDEFFKTIKRQLKLLKDKLKEN